MYIVLIKGRERGVEPLPYYYHCGHQGEIRDIFVDEAKIFFDLANSKKEIMFIGKKHPASCLKTRYVSTKTQDQGQGQGQEND